MKILSYNPNVYAMPSFGTNCRGYEHNDLHIGTQTYMFREDLDWNEFTNFVINNFKDKEKVNIIQFAPSDGSEAYSLIINLLETNKRNAGKFFPIQAYDIDKEVIKASKSGIINMSSTDRRHFYKNGIPFDEYFSDAEQQLYISKDIFSSEKYKYRHLPSYATTSYKVSDTLTSRVNFNFGNMFDIVKNIKDDSNSLVLCRNILGYFSEKETDQFLTDLSNNIKSGSIFVVGTHDMKDKYFDKLVQSKGFRAVMRNVYRKI